MDAPPRGEGGVPYDNQDEEEDHKRDNDHLLPLPSPHDDHLRHHLLQALLLRGSPEREP